MPRPSAARNKIVVDSIEQSKMEAGDLIQAFGEDAVAMERSAGAIANRRRQRARQKQRRSNHFVQIEWNCNVGSGGRRARIRNGGGAAAWASQFPSGKPKNKWSDFSSTGFSLWGLVLARTKPHRLKSVLLSLVQQMLRPSQDKAAGKNVVQRLLLLREPRNEVANKQKARNLPAPSCEAARVQT